MATITRSLSDTAGFIPQSWATEALKVLRQNIAMVKTIARDTDFNDMSFKGKSITVPYPGVFTAQAKTPGSLATVQTPSNGSSVTLTLGTHNTVDFILEDVDFSQAQSGMKMMEAYGEAAGIALAEQIETDTIAQYSTFTGGVTGTAGTDLISSSFRLSRKLLNDAKAPMSDRSFLVSTKDASSLLGDTNLQSYFAFNNTQALKEGSIGRFMGFDIFESQFLQAVTGHETQTVIIGGGATGGTFTLTYGAQTTAAIAFGATAAAVQAALVLLSTITTAANVLVSGLGTSASPYVISFIGTLSTGATAVTGSAGSLTGGTPTLTVADATTQGTRNLAYHKNSVMIAFRPIDTPSTAGVEVAYANDPMSGVSLRILMQYQPQYRGVYVAYDVLYGLVGLRNTQGVVAMA